MIRWCAEIAGVLALAVAAALWWLPLGLVVCGLYLVLIANSGGE
jgi:hypothetical protein